jgi:hypothetical protein
VRVARERGGLIEFGAGESEASLLTFEEVVDNDQRLR